MTICVSGTTAASGFNFGGTPTATSTPGFTLAKTTAATGIFICIDYYCPLD